MSEAWNDADAYQEETRRTQPGGDALLYGAIGLCGEAGEVADLVKKHKFQGHPLDREHLARELGDVAWYLAATADAIGVSLSDVFEVNVEKLRARYPEGFDPEKSMHREKGDL